MRKLFLLIPALALSLLANAKVIEISSSTSNIIHSTIAASTTSDGDVIVLTDAGPYVNSKANKDDYTKIAKNVTIKAADGIQPVIKFEVPIQARDGKSGKFIGIKFDGSSLQYDQFIFVKDDDLNDNELEFEDCEFYNSSKYIVSVPASTKANSLVFKNCKFYNNSTNRGILNQGNIGRLELDGCEVSNFVKEFIHGYSGTSHVDECVVNDCYFHDNSRSSIMFVASTVDGTQTCDQLTVTNSTFSNIDASGEYESVIDIRPYGTAVTDAIQVLVDHCTFYNNTVKNSDHANIRTAYLSDVTVSNCIFYYPSEYATRATYCTGGGNINNCITYNYTAEGTKGHAYGATVNAASIIADPLFNDLVNNKYTYAGEYGVSMSPARGAATDGSDLGDPRWYTPVTYPSTNFAAPGYACSADAATIPTGVYGLSLYTESEPHYIICSSVAYNTLLGTWAITATRACYVTVGLDLGPEIDNNKHIFEVKILDKDGNPVGSLAEDPADPTGATENNTEANQLKTIDGSILIPAAGDYTIELRNLRGPGKGSIKNIILTYDGDVPITDFAAPGYTFLAKRAELAGNIEYNTTTATPYIRYTDNSDPGTATWNITATRACQVKVAMNMVDNSAYSNGNGKHRFVVELLEGNVVKSSIEEPSEVDENGRTFPRSYDMPEYITIPAAGDYTIRVRNPRANSRCGLASITLTYSYEGGNVVNIPVAAIPFEDALLHDGATRDGEGLHFMNAQYVEWNIHAAEGLYTFSATCTSSNYSNLTIKVKQGASELYSYTPQYTYNTTDKVISSPQWLLEEGDYTLQLINPTSGNGYVSALSATAASGYFILNDDKTDDGSIAAANYDASNTTYNILLKRSFTAGRYYTICIPMDFYHSLLASKFGEDYELWRMVSAEQEGDAINLNFEKYVSDGESQNFEPAAGTPFLLKPSVDVENPVFSTKKVRNYTDNNVKDCGAADFVGTFYKTEIPAGENNLYLQNNNLYYSETNDTPIKGTRAWIRLKPQGPNYVKARIMLGPKVVTSINLVNGELLEGAVKTIENGQLVIIRDGVKYNAMGIKLQ